MNIEENRKVGIKLSNLQMQLFGVLAFVFVLLFGIVLQAIIWREQHADITETEHSSLFPSAIRRLYCA